MDDALVEKVARAICTADEQNGAAPWDWYGSDKAREGYFDQARAVLALPDLRLAGVKEGLEMAKEADRPDDAELEPHLPERIKAEKRCGIEQSDWLPGWYVPWSPRNDNQNAEGPWSHWVALAHAIIAADQSAIRSLGPRP